MPLTYVKPQVLVYQEFNLAPSEITVPLRAHISGPNVMLHRYSVNTEKALINVGPYTKDTEQVYPWPGRIAGSIVDPSSVGLFIENALLLYFEDLIGDESGGRGLVTPVTDHKNWIRDTNVSFKANGTQSPRSGFFGDRDVQIGDIVYVRGVADSNNSCVQYELWTEVTGFAADDVAPTIFPVELDENNESSKLAAHSVTQTAGPTNCIAMEWDGSSNYNGLAAGLVKDKYTVTVTKSSIAGCNAARLRITSDSGTDDMDDVDPGAIGDVVDIGTRGVQVIFHANTGACVTEAEAANIAPSELVVGQTWEIDVTMAWERTCAINGDIYNGPDNDTYIVTVTKGGHWDQEPEVTITSTKGLDSSGPTIVTGANIEIPVGSWGMSITFKDCTAIHSSSSISANADSLGMGDDNLPGLRLGDKFYIAVVSGQNGPIKTLILQDDLPKPIQGVTDLDLRLFITKDIQITENRLSAPPLVNYSIEETELVVNAGITAYDSTWTRNGVEQPLLLWDGMNQSVTSPNAYGIQYIQYNEFLYELTTSLSFISDVADIDQIPGPLDVGNTLKWGVYCALQNSNGTNVGYTAVQDPSSLDSWVNVLNVIAGRPDVYNLVPLTHNVEVQDLFKAQVLADSSPEAGCWKAMFVGLQAVTELMVVGQSTANAQLLTPTSVDGGVVLATLEDNPEATDIQYTLLSVPANNSGFINYSVQPGDIVRFLFTIDAFGDTMYQEFVVDQVLSQNSLLLLSGYSDPITVPQKVEIWHTLNKEEIDANLQQQAGAFASTRVCAVWPDVVGTGGLAQDGYFLCCALAGLASGVVPHQGLTNVEISGFDDLTSRTTKFFTASQLDELAGGGVWIGTQDLNGVPYSRHALTTDMTDLNHQEEMIRRNVDSISFLFLNNLKPYIGRANATPAMVTKLRYQVLQTIKYLKSNGYTDELGPQLIDGSIAVDANGVEQLYIHPLAADRIVIVLNLTVPAPLNNIELHLVV